MGMNLSEFTTHSIDYNIMSIDSTNYFDGHFAWYTIRLIYINISVYFLIELPPHEFISYLPVNT